MKIRSFPRYFIPLVVLLGAGCGETREETISAAGPGISDSVPARLMNHAVIGQQYADAVKAALGKHLFSAVAEEGAAGAVAFCNTRAIALTDSVAASLHVAVQRVSDRPRNPMNRANATEQKFIEMLAEKIRAAEPVSTGISEGDETVTTYHPILINGACLQCHGNPGTDMLPETQARIRDLYPDDQATGYADGQVRGLFVVTMDKVKEE